MFSPLQQHVENQRRTLLKKKIKANEHEFVLKKRRLSFIFCLLKKMFVKVLFIKKKKRNSMTQRRSTDDRQVRGRSIVRF